jgi:hypothetical protein
MLSAAIVLPDHKVVIPFAPELIVKTDGANKNDRERNDYVLTTIISFWLPRKGIISIYLKNLTPCQASFYPFRASVGLSPTRY